MSEIRIKCENGKTTEVEVFWAGEKFGWVTIPDNEE